MALGNGKTVLDQPHMTLIFNATVLSGKDTHDSEEFQKILLAHFNEKNRKRILWSEVNEWKCQHHESSNGEEREVGIGRCEINSRCC